MLKVQTTRIKNKQFQIYISDKPVTLKQGKGHQSKNDNVDLKQGYNYESLKDLALMVSKK